MISIIIIIKDTDGASIKERKNRLNVLKPALRFTNENFICLWKVTNDEIGDS